VRAVKDLHPPQYHASFFAANGAIICDVILFAETDVDAMRQVKAMVDVHSIDLWCGPRFIEYYPAAAAQS
jgi:hypothetical protein